MLTKSVNSVISVVLNHVAREKKSVQSVRSVSYNIRMILPDINNFEHQLITLRPTVSYTCCLRAVLWYRASGISVGQTDFSAALCRKTALLLW